MLWDLFCRVIDNFGDVGVCWRLARDLASRGHTVRLWIDDARALEWMAPGGAEGVTVGAFDAPGPPGDVVIEAFGCDPPPAFVAAMRARPPVWINLEYLSAEDYVERSHGLPSPQPGGLMKWFFYPGFTERTGGLLREPGLDEARAAFDARPWLAAHGIAPAPGERLASVFCYDALPALVTALQDRPTLLLLAPGAAQQLQGADNVRTQALPFLPQPDYDRLLWSCELNFVRGEDSLVRAMWSGAPLVWQIYPQADGVHEHKLQALLERLPPVPGLPALWRGWNSLPGGTLALPPVPAWRAGCTAWRQQLMQQPDLVTQLLDFVAGHRQQRC